MAANATSVRFSMEDDLEAAWKQIIDECDRTAGWSKQDKKIMTVSDVINNINPHEEVQPTTARNAKKFIKTTLVCIQRFGDVVATATAAVFPPSQQCFNAVNFVIIATQNTGEFFTDVTTLMERVSVFLESLSVYLDDETITANSEPNKHAKAMLDKRLRPRVYHVLEHFISVMTLTHALATRKKREKVKVFAKNLLLGKDDRIKDALATLETRISDITRIQVTVIGQDLKGAARDIREMKADMNLMLSIDEKNTNLLVGLKESEDERRIHEIERTNEEFIRLKLSLENKQWWRNRHIKISEERASGTGSWLVEKNRGFIDWADIQNESVSSVFALSAPEGYGKTFLTHAVIEHLLSKYKRQSGGRCVELAYFYLPNILQQAKTEAQESSQINKAVKAIVYQLYQSNAAYRKFVRSACEEDINFGATGQIWTKLIFEYAIANEVNFFVVIDGIEVVGTQEEHLLSAIASQVSTSENAKSSARLRVFFTGRPYAIRDSQQRCGISEPQISLEEEMASAGRLANDDDIRQVLEARLKRIQNSWQEDSSMKLEHKTRIQEVLLQHVRGNYDRHDLVLREIEHCMNVKQLEDVLSQVNESQPEKIARQIEILNQILSQGEIIELNAITSWLHDSQGSEWSDRQKSTCHFSTHLPRFWRSHQGMAKNWNEKPRLHPRNNSPQLSVLEDYLAMTIGSERFVTLQKQINDRYSPLLKVDEDNLVIWKYDELKSFRLKTGESIVDQMARRRRFAFPAEELALIQKIVKTQFVNVFGKDGDILYDRYGLGEFFGSKTHGQEVRIKLDPGASHATILNACLIAMCEQHDTARTPNLRKYAYRNFKHHIQRADPQQVDTSTVQSIGRRLVKLMREEAFADLWWSNPSPSGASSFAPLFADIFADTFADAMRGWLCHPAVLEKFEEIPLVHDWLRKLSATETPTKVLMAKVAEIAAKRWYFGELSNWFSPYEFLLEYVQHRPGYVSSHLWPVDKLRPADRVEDWIKTEFSTNINDLCLLSLRVGQMLFKLSDKNFQTLGPDAFEEVELDRTKYEEAALERCEAALSLQPKHLRAATLKAQIDMRHNQYEKVLQYLNATMASIQKDVSAQESTPTDDWRLGYKLLSDCYFKIGNNDMAVTSFFQAINVGVDNYEYHRIVAWFLYALRLFESPDNDLYVMRLVQFLDDFETPEGINLRSILTHELQSHHHGIIIESARRTGAFQLVTDTYRKALAEAFESTMPLKDDDLERFRKIKVEYTRLLLHVGTPSKREEASALFQQNASEEDEKT